MDKKMKRQIRGLKIEELEQELKSMGQQKFRAKQIFKWVQHGVTGFEEMSDISKSLRESLDEAYLIDNVGIVQVLVSGDGTRKYLLKMVDDSIIEAVLMKYKYGYTICISTQVGCRMGCSFCASTIDGMDRNLNAGEMIGQILAVQNDLRIQDKEGRISRVVLMGSGEPLDNFEETCRFLELVNHDDGLNISHRNITLSTCGIVPKIKELADMNLQITLALSFHAFSDAIRSKLMPINRKYPIDEVIKACEYYFNKTKRRVTFEYALISGENDTPEGARSLGKLLAGKGIHVNLIPVNKVEEKGFKPSSNDSIRAFAKELEKFGIETTVRRELGSDINAACGQLRKKYLTS